MDEIERDPRVVLPAGCSQLELLAAGLRDGRDAAVDGLDAVRLYALETNWLYAARAGQLPPPGKWRTWLILAGRGFGKTRAGAEWVRAQAETDGKLRIALVAATLAEARAVMVEGDSGLLAIGGGRRPKYEASLRRLTWDNGAQAFLYSAAEPESLRGPQHHLAWCDEIAKWPLAEEAWANLAFGLRLGAHPRTVATTTPRAVALVKTLLAEAERGRTAVTRGRTADNLAHLAPAFVEAIHAEYAGTARGRQELDGELIDDVEGALWSRALLEACRVTAPPDALARVVIGVDPPASAGGDACGIVAVALGGDGRAYVLADASLRGAPEAWAAAVAVAAAILVTGVARVLRPSFAALVAAEEELGSLFRFVERVAGGDAKLAEMAALLWHCLVDQDAVTGDGARTGFVLVKRYGAAEPEERRITRPVAGSVRVAVDGVERLAGWTLEAGGTIRFTIAPPAAAAITAGCRFDVPVRFADDRLEVSLASVTAGDAPEVALIEVREG